MTKKTILIAILQKLIPHRPLLEGILAMIESPDTTEAEMDDILNLISTQLQAISKTEDNAILNATTSYLDQLKAREQAEKISEEADLEQLLLSIESL